jgi:hypothetical protein
VPVGQPLILRKRTWMNYWRHVRRSRGDGRGEVNARVTVAGFVIFVIASVSWLADGWFECKTSLVIQNAILLLINVLGVWRRLPKLRKRQQCRGQEHGALVRWETKGRGSCHAHRKREPSRDSGIVSASPRRAYPRACEGATPMPDYRAYIIGIDGHFVRAELLVNQTDEAAALLVARKFLVETEHVEV